MGATIRVVHVDDEPEFTELTKTYIERDHDRIAVETAERTTEAMDILAAEDVDCVVADYQMQPKNGLQFLEEVRDAYPELPYILFTGRGSEDIASEAISAGVTNYLTKGRETARYELLANQIENAVESYRAADRAREVRSRYEALFDQDRNAIVWVEFEGETPIIEDANTRFETIFANGDQDVIGRDLDAVVASGDRQAEARELTRRVMAGEQLSGELTRETVDGPRQFHWQTIPVEQPGSAAIDGAFAVYTAVQRERDEIAR